MGKRSLLRQLFPALVSITAIALFAAGWDAMRVLRRAAYTQMEAELEARARLVEPEVLSLLESDPVELQSLCRSLGQRSATRLTVIGPSGRVLADSQAEPARMGNHADRSEFAAALAGRPGRALRYSFTLEEHMLYVAVPLQRAGQTVGALRAATAVGDIDQAIDRIRNRVLAGALVAGALAALGSLLVARRFARPWREMGEAAERFARGDLDYRLPPQEFAEARGLADALDTMAVQLDDRLRVLAEQRNRQEALLSSMSEGVLAVDRDERIIALNRAAAELFHVDAGEVQRRPLTDAIRNRGLQQFVRVALASSDLSEGEFVLHEATDRFLQAHGTVLRNGTGRAIGALIVLNDVTRLRRLETLRRDFVANVSHELKTPITTIRGFVETLQEGALREPQNAERFLEIIAQQAERLEAIVDDLLVLSRIEQEEPRQGIALEEGPVCEVLRAAIGDCRAKAEERGIEIDLSCEEGLTARQNATLLEQAMVNLLDNAIKYSEPGGRVAVRAESTPEEVVIRVQDEGPGIGPQHLPRIFERFYRVDKARGRKQGGTGLGLAIVKHIAQAHGGHVTVESVLGQGSTFSVHLPRSRPNV
jgi:two-component system, OmpR family, phosphate regulon sensor histidine kinase PhoR